MKQAEYPIKYDWYHRGLHPDEFRRDAPFFSNSGTITAFYMIHPEWISEKFCRPVFPPRNHPPNNWEFQGARTYPFRSVELREAYETGLREQREKYLKGINPYMKLAKKPDKPGPPMHYVRQQDTAIPDPYVTQAEKDHLHPPCLLALSGRERAKPSADTNQYKVHFMCDKNFRIHAFHKPMRPYTCVESCLSDRQAEIRRRIKLQTPVGFDNVDVYNFYTSGGRLKEDHNPTGRECNALDRPFHNMIGDSLIRLRAA